MLTSKECIKEIKKALKEFGEYSYYDKGIDEVMDVPALRERMNGMTAKQIADMLCEVLKFEHGEVFVRGIMNALDNREDLNDLYSDKRLAKYY